MEQRGVVAAETISVLLMKPLLIVPCLRHRTPHRCGDPDPFRTTGQTSADFSHGFIWTSSIGAISGPNKTFMIGTFASKNDLRILQTGPKKRHIIHSPRNRATIRTCWSIFCETRTSSRSDLMMFRNWIQLASMLLGSMLFIPWCLFRSFRDSSFLVHLRPKKIKNRFRRIHKKNLSFHMRRGLLARLKALLITASCGDVVERVDWVHARSVVIDLVRGTSVASSRHPFYWFFLSQKKKNKKRKTQEKKLKRKRGKKNWTRKFLQRDGKALCFEEEKVDEEQIQKDFQEEVSPKKVFQHNNCEKGK